MTATILRPQLRQALLRQLHKNSKRKRNVLQQGFTLVELMIVIVIVGILSAVALPNFLNQTAKAKATECTSKFGSILSQIAAEAQLSAADANTLKGTLVSEANDSSPNCTIAIANIATDGTATTFTGTVTGAAELLNKYAAKGCVNFANSKRDIKTATSTSGTAPTAANADCSIPTG
jgi:type IV pilus assembly protein PilA